MILKVIVLLCITGNILANQSHPKGLVDVNDCGSRALFVRLRVDTEDDPTTCGTAPCELQPDTPYSMNIDFIASASHVRVTWRLTVILSDGSEEIVLENLIGSGSIEEGQLYTLTYVLTPNAVLQGQLFDLRLEIYEAIENYKEVCIDAPFTIV